MSLAFIWFQNWYSYCKVNRISNKLQLLSTLNPTKNNTLREENKHIYRGKNTFILFLHKKSKIVFNKIIHFLTIGFCKTKSTILCSAHLFFAKNKQKTIGLNAYSHIIGLFRQVCRILFLSIKTVNLRQQVIFYFHSI